MFQTQDRGYSLLEPRANFRTPRCLGSQFYHFSLLGLVAQGGGGGSTKAEYLVPVLKHFLRIILELYFLSWWHKLDKKIFSLLVVYIV